jgi:glycosyltransferase involved in cell wall biosynthesis
MATDTQAPKKVAIVHDWLIGGGAEQVVLELHHMFPEAPIYTSYASDEWRAKLDGKVVTGFLQRWPFSKLRKFIPVLRIWWFTHLDFTGYDLVISSSGNGEAKGIKVPKGTTHICYCHSPTHFYWRHYDQYLKHPGFGGPLGSLGLRLLVGPLRRWDLKASQRPDYFIANSNQIRADIQRYYGRDATVIHPPVDVHRFEHVSATNEGPKKGFVTVGRQVPYKRTDLIVAACTKLQLPLTVVGKGPENAKLMQRAGPTVHFINDASNDDVAQCFANAGAFILAAYEDFGITAVEAMATGTPVIAYKAGGALDYVIPGKTGLFFDKQTVDSLSKTLQDFSSENFDRTAITTQAEQFSLEDFRRKLTQFIAKVESETQR